jgi:protoheme IX farnesyltransferase
VIGALLAVGGVIYLALATTPFAGALALATVVTYIFLYTPMKRRTTLNTVIGGIPGALPPVIGLAAAGNPILSDALILFVILFFWQMPHFLSLAWMYRNDYERAGYMMLPSLDPHGVSTSRQILLWSAGLIPISLLPKLVGMSGPIYFFGALLLGLGFVAFGIVLAASESRRNVHAKWVFYYSLLYLPILLLSMVLDRSGL